MTAAPEPTGHTVLAVDDEPDLLDAIRRVLTRRGHTVLCATGPVEALAVAEGHGGAVHLLLTDLRMPGGSGVDLAAGLVAKRPDVAVLFMSGLADGPDLPGPVLAKPFTPTTLAEAVDRVLS